MYFVKVYVYLKFIVIAKIELPKRQNRITSSISSTLGSSWSFGGDDVGIFSSGGGGNVPPKLKITMQLAFHSYTAFIACQSANCQNK